MSKSNIINMKINISKLIACPFGRDVDSRHVSKIVRDFDYRAIGVIIVADINNHKMIVDGNHRVEAIRIRNRDNSSKLKEVECQVHKHLAIEEAAELYMKLNQNRKQLSRYDIFTAGIHAGDSRWISINDAIIAAGMRAAKSSTKRNAVSSIRVIESIYEKYGAQIITESLLNLFSIWEGSKESKRGEFISGMAYLINYTNTTFKPDGFSHTSLRNKLATESPEKLYKIYRSRVLYVGTNSEPAWSIMANVLAECYNRGRRNNGKRFPSLML